MLTPLKHTKFTNKLSAAKKTQIITALCEGCSVRSTSRMTGAAKGTILRLLAQVGTACAEYHNATVRNVKANRVQVDELWSFCYCKQKQVTEGIAESADRWRRLDVGRDGSSVQVGHLIFGGEA